MPISFHVTRKWNVTRMPKAQAAEHLRLVALQQAAPQVVAVVVAVVAE